MRLVPAARLIVMTTSPALAQREPEIVIPGKPGEPVSVFGGRNHGHHPGWIPGPGRVAPDRP